MERFLENGYKFLGEQFSFIEPLIEKDEDGSINVDRLFFYVKAIGYLSFFKEDDEDIRLMTASKDLGIICFHSQDVVQTYNDKLEFIAEIKLEGIRYAILETNLYIGTRDRMYVYTPAGKHLYDFDCDCSDLPDIHSSKYCDVIDFDSSFIVVDPYMKRHEEVVNKGIAHIFCKGNMDYAIEIIEDAIVVIRTIRVPFGKKFIVTSTMFVFIKDTMEDDRLYLASKKKLTKYPVIVDTIYPVAITKGNVFGNSLLISFGATNCYYLVKNGDKIGGYALGKKNKGTKTIAATSLNGKDIHFVEDSGSLGVIHVEKDKSTVICAIPFTTKLFTYKVHNGKLYFYTGDKLFYTDGNQSDTVSFYELGRPSFENMVGIFMKNDIVSLPSYDYTTFLMVRNVVTKLEDGAL